MDQLKECLSNYIPNNCGISIDRSLIDQYIRNSFTTDPRQVSIFVLKQVRSSSNYGMLKSSLNNYLVNVGLAPIS